MTFEGDKRAVNCLPCAAHQAADLIASLLSERDELRKLVYAPGVMRCAKCSFRLIRATLNASDGSVRAGTNETEPCPNGCGPLWPVTWRDEAKAADVAMEQQFDRAAAAEAGRDDLRKVLERIRDVRLGVRDPAGDGGTYILTGHEYRQLQDIARQALSPEGDGR